ncbi:hypothetical protein SAMN05892883_3951 [Jatrophihabitans sp. GAS493]|uniref:hypothetical protein n=1 Tax=Jatrophihabitans sp. GAS493 TaxID=1907575 RepID=UPI000BB6C585|nr:hypothetical protein [Jatrophihabitans sp. GAS493]SOD74760.1 hypothetical protein SAMN05892883_3951 [Jatrophihabitans sp. GAS493]
MTALMDSVVTEIAPRRAAKLAPYADQRSPQTTFTDSGIADPLRLLTAADRALTNDAAVTWLILLLSQSQSA